MRIKLVSSIFLYFVIVGNLFSAGAIEEWYQSNIVDGFRGIPTNSDLATEFGEAFVFKQYATQSYDILLGARCHAKNGSIYPRGPITEEQVAENNRRHVFMYGDSLTAGIKVDESGYFQIDPYVYYGENSNKMNFVPVGGSTSEDLRFAFDKHSDGNPFLFYPNPGVNSHINVENRTAVILIGGNDFVRFELVLKAIPWLTVFRQNSVVNNLNRIVTYHQAQGARILLISQTPRPSVAPTNFFMDLGPLGNFFQQAFGVFLNSLGSAIVNIAYTAANIEECIGSGNCYRPISSPVSVATTVYSGGSERTFEAYFLERIKAAGVDNTWLSMQLGYQTLMVRNLVAMTRNVEYLDEWYQFADQSAITQRKWWEGNPTLYSKDKIHFSHPWGHSLHATNVTQKLSSLGWWNNPTPTQGDRCNFTSTASFPTGQPAGWTEEPPELPGVDDNALFLLILCIYFGHCSL